MDYIVVFLTFLIPGKRAQNYGSRVQSGIALRFLPPKEDHEALVVCAIN